MKLMKCVLCCSRLSSCSVVCGFVLCSLGVCVFIGVGVIGVVVGVGVGVGVIGVGVLLCMCSILVVNLWLLSMEKNVLMVSDSWLKKDRLDLGMGFGFLWVCSMVSVFCLGVWWWCVVCVLVLFGVWFECIFVGVENLYFVLWWMNWVEVGG